MSVDSEALEEYDYMEDCQEAWNKIYNLLIYKNIKRVNEGDINTSYGDSCNSRESKLWGSNVDSQHPSSCGSEGGSGGVNKRTGKVGGRGDKKSGGGFHDRKEEVGGGLESQS